MHCHRTDDSVHLIKDIATDKHNLMDFPSLTSKQKPQQTKPRTSEKKLFVEAKGIQPHKNDILLGRGGKNNMHVGNEKLRELARKVADQYHRSSKKEKSYLSRSLVQKVLEMDPPGRFLRRHPKQNFWEDKSDDEDKAREKCAQVLRDAVAYVGLKEAPPPRPAQMELQQQQLQQSPFAGNQNIMSLHPLQQRQYQMQLNNPFAMSAASSSSIMNHHMMASGNMPVASRQYSFPNFNPPTTDNRLNSLASVDGYDSLLMPNNSSVFANNMPPLAACHQTTMQQQTNHSGAPLQQGIERGAKRRRFSNFNDQYGSMSQTEPTIYGYDRRPSLAPVMNSYPVGLDYQQHQAPGPRLEQTQALASRRDSLFGSLSLAPDSDHTGGGLGMKDFELFPEMPLNDTTITEQGATRTPPPPTKNDGDEFSSEFY